MDKETVRAVEQEIDYCFRNKSLLQQAFTRKSRTDEQGYGTNNEILEFYGDSALNLVVAKEISEYYGSADAEEGYVSPCNEASCTEIRKKLVNSKVLAARMDDLGFAKYLIMSKGDVKSGAQDQTHVKEDLFEAIIGAVAIDSGWSLPVLENTVELMLHLDQFFMHDMKEYRDYVSLIQQWSQKKHGALPGYVFRTMEEEMVFKSVNGGSFREFGGRSYAVDSGHREEDHAYVCHLYLENMDFTGYGYSKSEAREDSAETAYAYLEKHGLLITIADEAGTPAPEKAVSQLQELAQKGYFSMPKYSFEETHTEDGNPVWRCDVDIQEYSACCRGTASTKKEAKQQAAYGMLCGILSHDKGPERD